VKSILSARKYNRRHQDKNVLNKKKRISNIKGYSKIEEKKMKRNKESL
jgi:hypothetical protein